jgi:hypothetical protein
MFGIFIDHPATVGESYWEHLAFATRFGIRMVGAGAACIVHGVLPFLFPSTGSRTVRALYGVLNNRRAGHTVSAGMDARMDQSEYVI